MGLSRTTRTDGRLGRLGVRRSAALVAAAALVLGASGAITALTAGGSTLANAKPPTLYVSPHGAAGKADISCSTAAYSTIQSAVTAAPAGETVEVCAGTYTTQVTISKQLTLAGSGGPVVDPTSSSPATVSDLDTNQAAVAIIDVTTGATVTMKGLNISGAGLKTGFSGCGEDFVGVFYQDASGAVSTVAVRTVQLPAGLFGCQQGVGIFVQSGPSGHATVALHKDTVTGFDKGGIVCNDAGTTCTVGGSTVTGSGPSTTAQNALQIAFGAAGTVTDSTFSDVDYAPGGAPAQSTYGAGILLFGTASSVAVTGNTLSNDQAGIELSDSSATLRNNALVYTPGITGAIGIYAVPCTMYCPTFTLSPRTTQVTVASNKLSFAPATGTVGIWLGDNEPAATGVVHVSASGNTVSGAQQSVQVDATAYGSISIPAPSGAPQAPAHASADQHAPTHLGPGHYGPIR